MSESVEIPEEKSTVEPEVVFIEKDDAKANVIENGGNVETSVIIPKSASYDSFTGLSKDELMKYANDPFWVRLRWALFIIFWVVWVAMLLAAILIIILAPKCPDRADLKWYDTDVIYNIYAKSFFDGDKKQDGYGDLEGLKEKLEYIHDLNANSIWLSSIFHIESDSNDRGVIDHKNLSEKFGSLESFRAFCKKLFKEGRRVIVDLIPNQTSKSHAWFIKSRQRVGKYTDYYIWRDNENNWVQSNGKTMWEMDHERKQLYFTQFGDLPDLNLTNPDVVAEFKIVMKFWKDNGVSGFHINDMEYLAEDFSQWNEAVFNPTGVTVNSVENAGVVSAFRSIVDGLDSKPGKEKLLTGMVTSPDPSVLKLYFGQEKMPGLHVVPVVLDQLTDVVSVSNMEQYLQDVLNASSTNRLGLKLTTMLPGTDRVFHRLGANRMTIGHALQAFLPGSSMPYYGDEIAMNNAARLPTISPMQWSKDANAGFTLGNQPWLPVNDDYRTKNVDTMTAQLGEHSLMRVFVAMNKLRSAESFQFGETMFCSAGSLLIFARRAPGFDSYLVVCNFDAASATHVFLDAPCIGEHTTATLAFHSDARYTDYEIDLKKAVELGGHDVVVFKMLA